MKYIGFVKKLFFFNFKMEIIYVVLAFIATFSGYIFCKMYMRRRYLNKHYNKDLYDETVKDPIRYSSSVYNSFMLPSEKIKAEVYENSNSIILKNISNFSITTKYNNWILFNSRFRLGVDGELSDALPNMKAYVNISENLYKDFGGCGDYVLPNSVELYMTNGMNMFNLLPANLKVLYLSNCNLESGNGLALFIPDGTKCVILENCFGRLWLPKSVKFVYIKDCKIDISGHHCINTTRCKMHYTNGEKIIIKGLIENILDDEDQVMVDTVYGLLPAEVREYNST